MNIGIIGMGVVGSVLFKVFSSLKNKCLCIDLKNQNQIPELLKQDIIYICLPTNLKGKRLDTKSIEKYLLFLDKKKYKGTIAIKSTLNLGDTKKFKKKFRFIKKKICFVPEFLRERVAYLDFTKNHDLLLIGSSDKNSIKKIIKNHSKYPKRTQVVKPVEAELIKIFSNSYNASRVVFANSFYEVCKSLKVDYQKVLSSYLLMGKSTGNYLNCTSQLRGFGGKCLPKDLATLNFFSSKKTKKVKFFNYIIMQNKKFKTTIKK